MKGRKGCFASAESATVGLAGPKASDSADLPFEPVGAGVSLTRSQSCSLTSCSRCFDGVRNSRSC